MKVCAFLTDGFETVEALAVVDILRRADIKTDMISITGDINVKSAQGVIVQADELLDEYVFEGDELFRRIFKTKSFIYANPLYRVDF